MGRTHLKVVTPGPGLYGDLPVHGHGWIKEGDIIVINLITVHRRGCSNIQVNLKV